MEALRDPQTLIDPVTISRIRDVAAAEESGAAVRVAEEGLRAALAGAMHDVFLLGLGVTILAVVVTLFLREIPLRKTIMETPRGSDISSSD